MAAWKRLRAILRAATYTEYLPRKESTLGLHWADLEEIGSRNFRPDRVFNTNGLLQKWIDGGEQIDEKKHLFHRNELQGVRYKITSTTSSPMGLPHPHGSPSRRWAIRICTPFAILPFFRWNSSTRRRLPICPVVRSHSRPRSHARPATTRPPRALRPCPRPFRTHKRTPVVRLHDPVVKKRTNSWGPFASPAAFRHVTLPARRTPAAASAGVNWPITPNGQQE